MLSAQPVQPEPRKTPLQVASLAYPSPRKQNRHRRKRHVQLRNLPGRVKGHGYRGRFPRSPGAYPPKADTPGLTAVHTPPDTNPIPTRQRHRRSGWPDEAQTSVDAESPNQPRRDMSAACVPLLCDMLQIVSHEKHPSKTAKPRRRRRQRPGLDPRPLPSCRPGALSHNQLSPQSRAREKNFAVATEIGSRRFYTGPPFETTLPLESVPAFGAEDFRIPRADEISRVSASARRAKNRFQAPISPPARFALPTDAAQVFGPHQVAFRSFSSRPTNHVV